MKEIEVKNVPEHLYETLVQRAKSHRRSLNTEVLFLLEQALQADYLERSTAQELLQEARKLREHFNAPPPYLERRPVEFSDWL